MERDHEEMERTHRALNDLLALFVFRHGYDYHVVDAALAELRQNHQRYGFPITAAFMEPPPVG